MQNGHSTRRFLQLFRVAEFEGLGADTRIEPGMRGSLYELQVRLCRVIIEFCGRLNRLLTAVGQAGYAAASYPPYLIKGFSEVVSTVLFSAKRNADNVSTPISLPADTAARFLYYIDCALDPYEKKVEKEGFLACERPCEKSRFALEVFIKTTKTSDIMPFLCDFTHRLCCLDGGANP